MHSKMREILNAKGLILENRTNCNGTFVTLRVAGPAHKAAAEIARELRAAFPKAHVPLPTSWSATEYHLQFNTKRPALLGRGVVYSRGEFGETTEIKIKS